MAGTQRKFLKTDRCADVLMIDRSGDYLDIYIGQLCIATGDMSTWNSADKAILEDWFDGYIDASMVLKKLAENERRIMAEMQLEENK